jgi:hypothetical protein
MLAGFDDSEPRTRQPLLAAEPLELVDLAEPQRMRSAVEQTGIEQRRTSRASRAHTQPGPRP